MAVFQSFLFLFTTSMVSGKSIMQFLNPTYVMLLFFGLKILIYFKDFIYYRKNLSG